MDTLTDRLVTEARDFALVAHGDQKYGDLPYSAHLEAVARLASPFGYMAEAIAWLHDTVEDTDVTLDDIEEKFGRHIRNVVALLTDEPGETRSDRKAATNAKLAQVDTYSFEGLALLVKICDRLANVRSSRRNSPSLHKMYQGEHAAFRRACYRPKHCDGFWQELEIALVDL